MFLFPTLLVAAAPPNEDPAASYKLSWTANLAWPKAIDITTAEGADADAKLASAQAKLAAQGGGVVFFPAGTYHFKQSIKLKDGVVLRGVPPVGETDARKEGYRLGSVLEFPKYEFKASGDGTPIDTAFKSIELENPATGSNIGVVHLDINRGHILLKQADDGACSKNRLIVGCILRNTAFAVLLIPDPKGGFLPVIIRADDVNFKGGDVYFYNHTPKPVLGYVGTAKFMLKPEEGKLLRPAGAKEETYYDVGFGVREAEGDRVMRTLRWPVLTRSRSYVFFYQNPVKNRIDFRAVDEFVAPQAEVQPSP